MGFTFVPSPLKTPDVNHRHHLFFIHRKWDALNRFGRIYVAREGINAQMSVPEHSLEEFLQKLDQYYELKDSPKKYSVKDVTDTAFRELVCIHLIQLGGIHQAHHLIHILLFIPPRRTLVKPVKLCPLVLGCIGVFLLPDFKSFH